MAGSQAIPTTQHVLPSLKCHVPEKVPEKTPGAWFTKLSMTAPGLRERVAAAAVGLLLPWLEEVLAAPGLTLLLVATEQSIC